MKCSQKKKKILSGRVQTKSLREFHLIRICGSSSTKLTALEKMRNNKQVPETCNEDPNIRSEITIGPKQLLLRYMLVVTCDETTWVMSGHLHYGWPPFGYRIHRTGIFWPAATNGDVAQPPTPVSVNHIMIDRKGFVVVGRN